MDLTDRTELRALLARHGITLAKTYGQHFLVDRRVLEMIVETAFPIPYTLFPIPLVFEVGPGAGTLTRELAARAGRVIAVERDPRFLPVLEETLSEFGNVQIIEADALKISFSQLTPPYTLDPRPYTLVSNLPYEITTPFLWKILEEEPVVPAQAVLLIQADVAERILAKPPKMNLLALLVQLSGEVKLVRKVPASAFFPPPRVQSAIIEIIPRLDIRQAPSAKRQALSLARRAFANPRKKLGNTLGNQAGRFAARRPGELGVEDWLEL